MVFWQAFTRNSEMQALGWTLINFLWQGTLITLALKAALTALRRQTADLRYLIATATLLLLVIVPVLTFCIPREAPAPTRSHAGTRQTVNTNTALADISVDGASTPFVQPAAISPKRSYSAKLSLDRWTHELPARFPEALPFWIAGFWILGFAVIGIRLLGGLVQANLLKNNAREFNCGDNIRLFNLKSGAAERVRLLESAGISVPTVIGWLRPAVLFPAGVAIQSSHLQALLAHELEHVRRRDYLVNLLQTVIETLLFFHPAVWWVSAQMRAERECCCDDAAVKSCGDLRVYLRALSEAEHRRSGTRLVLALSGTSLLNRIRRLTEMRSVQNSRWKTWSTVIPAFAVLLLFSAAAILLAFVPVQAKPAIIQAPAQEGKATMPKAALNVSSNPATVPWSGVHRPPQPAGTIPLSSLLASNKPKSMAGMQQQASPEKITGMVFDPTGGVLPGANVSIFDAETKELLGTTVAFNGSFEILPPAGDYSIQFAFPGFQTQVLSKSQMRSGPLNIEMELEPAQVKLEIVTAAPIGATPRLAGEPIRVGGSIFPPKLVKRAAPVYPLEAREANVEGAVVMSALIDAEGNVTNPVVVRGHHLLRDAALTCVGQWHYQPALLNGQPWPMRLSITIDFQLRP